MELRGTRLRNGLAGRNYCLGRSSETYRPRPLVPPVAEGDCPCFCLPLNNSVVPVIVDRDFLVIPKHVRLTKIESCPVMLPIALWPVISLFSYDDSHFFGAHPDPKRHAAMLQVAVDASPDNGPKQHADH